MIIFMKDLEFHNYSNFLSNSPLNDLIRRQLTLIEYKSKPLFVCLKQRGKLSQVAFVTRISQRVSVLGMKNHRTIRIYRFYRTVFNPYIILKPQNSKIDFNNKDAVFNQVTSRK